MRVLVALAVLGAGLLGVAPAPGEVASPTSLRVMYWEDGSAAAPTNVWTIRCKPTAGTLPRPSRACRRLTTGGTKLFAPLPPNMACTQIYGGPQRARVVGHVSGRRVRATFTRTDGCQISRWNALSPWLLPPGNVTR
jgi:hypothetical protein